jgi:hypothetical protein
MIYQLPNGKVIHLSIEEYLDLTFEDIQYLISIKAGHYANNPFHGSNVIANAKEKLYNFDDINDDELYDDQNDIIDDDYYDDDAYDDLELSDLSE